MKQKVFVALISTVILCPCIALAAVVYVPLDQPTIQAGIDAALDGDAVMVAPGTYVENLLFASRVILVRGESGADVTVIDGNATDSVVRFYGVSGSNMKLDGFTLTNGSADSGGGVLCWGASPTIMNCTITGNDATSGGGIRIGQAADPIIENCTITMNTGVNGAGLYCKDASGTITGSTLSGNSSTGTGGGVYCTNSSMTVTDSTFADNSGTYGGGFYSTNSTAITLEGCTFEDNTATTDDGGGVFGGGAEWIIRDCNFVGNTAVADGGGMSTNSTPTIENCTFSGNTAAYGGGLRITIFSEMKHCTITGNVASAAGGGVYCAVSSPAITNSILWGNSAPDGAQVSIYGTVEYPSTLIIRYSDVEGGQAAVSVGADATLTWAPNNIEADPLFTVDGYWDDNGTPEEPSDDFWVDGDYHLLEDSPCIDVGVDAGVTTDMDGDTRPDGAGYDMGADEYLSPFVPMPHQVAFIRHRTNDNQYLNVHDAPQTVDGEINPLMASDTWIGNVGTDNEITQMAGGDIDGDGVDELIFIRHRVNDNQYLNIYDVPEAVDGEITPLVASDTWIGNVGTDNEITHLAAGDADGDGTDELIFIRQRLNGNQYLNIYDIPTAVDSEITPLVASVLWIGNVGTDNEITHLAAGDIDGDGVDEVMFIRHRVNDNQYLNIYDTPTALDTVITPLAASDTWIGNVGTDNEITHLAAGDTDGDGTDELLFVRHRINDNQYLNIYDAPVTVGGDVTPLVASDLWIGNVGTSTEITHMTMVQ